MMFTRTVVSGISALEVDLDLFLAVKQNGESLAYSREEDDGGDEAPRHLQEG